MASDVMEKGRPKRFHGAFTGGFSAGYFNSVGSKGGWVPGSFTSSREARGNVQQRVEEFMDEDDLAHELAHSLSTLGQFRRGPTDACALVVSGEEYIGHRLLRRLGWRYGEGIGPRRRQQSSGKPPLTPNHGAIGCDLPEDLRRQREAEAAGADDAVEEDSDSEERLLQAPEDVAFEEVRGVHDGPAGLGFDPSTADPNTLLVQRARAKRSTTGQAKNRSNRLAFADVLQDDGSGIYGDGLEYDIGLLVRGQTERERKAKGAAPRHQYVDVEADSVPGFQPAKAAAPYIRPWFSPPVVPPDFVPFHNFSTDRRPHVDASIISVLTPKLRALLLDTALPLSATAPQKGPERVGETTSEEAIDIDAPADSVQLFQPLTGALKERFVTGSVQELAQGHTFTQFKGGLYIPKGDFQPTTQALNNPHIAEPTNDMERAALECRFGPATREVRYFFPELLLCKRFSVPDPHPYEPNKGEVTIRMSSEEAEEGGAAEAPIQLDSEDEGEDRDDLLDDMLADDGVAEEVRPPLDLFGAIFGDDGAVAAQPPSTNERPMPASNPLPHDDGDALQRLEATVGVEEAATPPPAAVAAPTIPTSDIPPSALSTTQLKIERLRRLLAESSSSSDSTPRPRGAAAVVVSSASEGSGAAAEKRPGSSRRTSMEQAAQKKAKKRKRKSKERKKVKKRKSEKKPKHKKQKKKKVLVVSSSSSSSSSSEDSST